MSKQNPTNDERDLARRNLESLTNSDRSSLRSLIGIGSDIHQKYREVESIRKRAEGANKALTALLNPVSEKRPGDALAKFADCYDALLDYLPPPFDVWSRFLEQYSVALRIAAEQLNRIAANISKLEQQSGVSYLGFSSQKEFIIKLLEAKSVAEVPKVPVDVINWYKDNRPQLVLLLGQAPSQHKKTFGGFDFLRRDEYDVEELRQWFYGNRDAVKYCMYGNVRLLSYNDKVF